MSPSPKSPGLLQLLTQPSTDTGHTQESPSERLSSPTEDMRLALNFSLILNDHWRLWPHSIINFFFILFVLESPITWVHRVALPYCQVTPKLIHETSSINMCYHCCLPKKSVQVLKGKGISQIGSITSNTFDFWFKTTFRCQCKTILLCVAHWQKMSKEMVGRNSGGDLLIILIKFSVVTLLLLHFYPWIIMESAHFMRCIFKSLSVAWDECSFV